ncbi:MAG: hypothetical protein GF383_04295 [Candidatus Lokiarchaeota archaeon]|nr:hypothetical protein [Candidatus Lokiarchaeota archaeon]MBD3338980.1 hypothetical protein [Candidatus Lokiarchaeota archaeon]
MLGLKAYVCQVCHLYNARSKEKIADLYEESKRLAEKKIKEEKLILEAIELEGMEKDEDIDLSIDEFEEEEEIPLKFEKRKASKSELEDSEEFTDVECPFCGELFDNLAIHIKECEFAPEDADPEDYLPSKRRRKKKESTKKSKKKKATKKCPHCGKEFIRLGRHLSACPKNPENKED